VKMPIYMDHNATTPVHPEVVEAMLPFLKESFGNPSSSTHPYGRGAARAVEEARDSIRRLIGAASPREIVFTAGATESDNLALKGICRASGGARNHIVTCSIEHEAVLETCLELEKGGHPLTVLPVDDHGRLDPALFEGAVTDRTLVASIMMANNELGTVEPLGEIGAVCRKRGVILHSDAVQAAGRVPVDVEALRVDLMSLTAHKMYGPKGVGALYIREGITVAPLLAGGGQEGGIRSGTLNVPGIVGFGAAARVALGDLHEESRRQSRLFDRMWDAIRERIQGVRLNTHREHRLPGTLNVTFEGVEAEALLTSLRDVAALSSGSACASGSGEGSYVIRAIGGGPAGARSSIRFGLGRSTTEQDVDRVAECLEGAVRRLRALAPEGAGAASGPPRN